MVRENVSKHFFPQIINIMKIVLIMYPGKKSVNVKWNKKKYGVLTYEYLYNILTI